MQNFNNFRRSHSSDDCNGKSKTFAREKQEFEPIYSDLANQRAVKTEIGEIIEVLDSIITQSLKEMNRKRAEDPLKYKQRAMYATELNAEIKSRIEKKIATDSTFGLKLRIRSNHGSTFFIVKDRYAIFIKKLNGKMNKPNSYPTPNSERTFSGELFTGTQKHIPFLFIGPNPNRDERSYVTSLISRREVNWTTNASILFNDENIVVMEKPEKPEVEVLTIKDSAKIKKRKSS